MADKFRKRPVVIEAMQWDGSYEVQQRIVTWSAEVEGQEAWGEPKVSGWFDGDYYLACRTLEGEMRANVGDWIIRGVQGEFYPCKPAIFEATYAEAGSPPTTPDNLRWAHMIDPTIARDQVRVQTAEGEYGRLLAQTSEIKLKRALRTADLLIADLEIQS